MSDTPRTDAAKYAPFPNCYPDELVVSAVVAERIEIDLRQLERELAAARKENRDTTIGADMTRGRCEWACSGGAGVECDLVQNLRNELAAARRDADRYRWLRSSPMRDGHVLVAVELLAWNEDGPTDTWYDAQSDDLDAAIDAALKP
jgi:hypothetical protein